MLDAVPLLSFWANITKIGTSALLDAVHACLQIMKPPEGKSGPPSRQTIAARLAAGKAKPAEVRSSQQDIQAKVSIYYVVQSPWASCATQAKESRRKLFSIPNPLL